MNEYVYSPLSIEAYFIPGLNGKCEAGSISTLDRGTAVWNLFWMSTPGIDAIPEHGEKWFNYYRATERAASGITADVMLDETLYRKLCMHPQTFSAWFSREDHSIYDAYDLLGEQDWVDNVLQRAEAASRRLALQVPALQRHDNVYHAVFGGARAA